MRLLTDLRIENRIYNRERLAVLFCGLIIIGLVSSRALISIGMIGLIVNAFLNSEIRENVRKFVFFPPLPLVGFVANTFKNPEFRSSAKRFLSNKSFAIATIPFLLVLFSGFYSEDSEHFLEKLRIKLPLLALPVALGSIRAFSTRQFFGLLYFFILVMTVSSIFVLANYATNFETITKSFLYGKAIPTPFNHIRFSLMLSLAIISGLVVLRSKIKLKWNWEKWIIGLLTVFLFIAIHVLSVRSGLLALYVALFFLILHYILSSRKFLVGGILLVVLAAMPVAAYFSFPSLKNKISYALWDLKMYAQGDTNYYSDTRRLVSIQVGIEVAKESLLFGVGAGDVRNEILNYYETSLPQIPTENRKLPHNQFVWVLAGTGIVGLLLFLFAILFPLFHNGLYKFPYVVAFHLIIFTSFLTEHTIETQIGTAFFSLFLVMILNYFSSLQEKAAHENISSYHHF